MKKIVIACGAGLATSSMVREKVEEELKEHGISFKIIQCTLHEVEGYDGQVDLTQDDYLGIGTLESYLKLKNYYGEDAVRPVYIEVEDGERLTRALNREKEQEKPKYEEMCRRFLADAADFSKEKLQEAGIHRIFYNEDLECTEEDIVCFMREVMMSEEG